MRGVIAAETWEWIVLDILVKTELISAAREVFRLSMHCIKAAVVRGALSGLVSDIVLTMEVMVTVEAVMMLMLASKQMKYLLGTHLSV